MNEEIVKLVRLTTGEDLLATMDPSESSEFYELTDVYQVGVVAEGKIGCVQYMPYTDAKDHLTIKKSSVMFVVTPSQALIDYYKSCTSKIAMPTSRPFVLPV